MDYYLQLAKKLLAVHIDEAYLVYTDVEGFEGKIEVSRIHSITRGVDPEFGPAWLIRVKF